MKKLVFAALVVAVAAVVGYRMWNKPHRDAASETAIQVKSDALYRAFATDEKKANAQYLNKALEVRGSVSSIDTNQDGELAVYLASEDPMFGVKCTMKDRSYAAKSGTEVALKGICTGYLPGADVILTDCTTPR